MRATLEVNPHRIAPRVKTARGNGTALTLTFDQSLKTTSTPATSAFTLGVGPIGERSLRDHAVLTRELELTPARLT